MIFFHEQLNFKNEDEWLCQLNKIIEISNDKWIEQNINISSEINDELNDVIQIQYRNIMNEIKFFIEHLSFSANLSYAVIRQLNDDNERVYFEMHIEDWWWKKTEWSFWKNDDNFFTDIKWQNYAISASKRLSDMICIFHD
jgi:hypothetical protein